MKLLTFPIAILFGFLTLDTVYAASEYATFASFYKESSILGIGLAGWIIAAVVTLAAVGVVIVTGVGTGGAGAPAAVVAVGTWFGNAMGLSGAVATNAGLALLGGGSIASGGFGMLGGAALLTAVFTFSTEIAIDYSIGAIDKIRTEYNYRSLVTKSRNMSTLPLPLNDSGPAGYEDAVRILEDVNNEKPFIFPANQNIINQAIMRLKGDEEVLDLDERSRRESLLSLLHFVSNDYSNARKHASAAVSYARHVGMNHVLPAFIYAASSAYEENFHFPSITRDSFRYAILDEPDNPLIPLLFSIYLDRISLRFDEGYLDERAFDQIFQLMQDPKISEFQLINYLSLLGRYLIQLKINQQKISALASTSSKKIKDSPKTLEVVENSLETYRKLLKGSKIVMKEIVFSLVDAPDEDAKSEIVKFYDLLDNYDEDRDRLAALVNDLRVYQQ